MHIRLTSTNKVDRFVVAKAQSLGCKAKRVGRIVRMNAVQTISDLKDDRKEVVHG